MIELGQIVCFLTIVEEKSFSRAALRLGLAQSAVSQKLRRLEDQVGFRLLDRTSRQVRLSPQGLEFVPFARQMMQAEVNARNAAQNLVQKNRNSLRIGGHTALSEQRIDIMQRFLAHVPEARLDVVHGSKDELLASLRKGTVDAVLSLAMPGAPITEFDSVFLKRAAAQVVLPANHSLASRDSLRIEDLGGMSLAISPEEQDPSIQNRICDFLMSKGIELVTAPEADRRMILAFALCRGLPSLRWIGIDAERHRIVENDLRIVPIEGDPLVLDYYIYSRRGPRSCLLQTFLEVATEPGPRECVEEPAMQKI